MWHVTPGAVDLLGESALDISREVAREEMYSPQPVLRGCCDHFVCMRAVVPVQAINNATAEEKFAGRHDSVPAWACK